MGCIYSAPLSTVKTLRRQTPVTACLTTTNPECRLWQRVTASPHGTLQPLTHTSSLGTILLQSKKTACVPTWSMSTALKRRGRTTSPTSDSSSRKRVSACQSRGQQSSRYSSRLTKRGLPAGEQVVSAMGASPPSQVECSAAQLQQIHTKVSACRQAGRQGPAMCGATCASHCM